MVDGEKFKIQGYTLVGIGGYRDVPRSDTKASQKKKYDESNNFFRKKLGKLLKNLDQRKTILIGHDQPRNTVFDKVNYPSSPNNGRSVGDPIIREFLGSFRPALYIGGHMHEHHGVSKLGETTLAAAGHGREGQCLILEIPSLKIEKVVL